MDGRKRRGIQDGSGREHIWSRDTRAMLYWPPTSTANQTEAGLEPVSGPLFDFAPQANEYLRTHLFGDIFERDNLDWQSRRWRRSACWPRSPVQPQLQSHIAISINIGLRAEALYELADVLETRFGPEAAERCAPLSGVSCNPGEHSELEIVSQPHPDLAVEAHMKSLFLGVLVSMVAFSFLQKQSRRR